MLARRLWKPLITVAVVGLIAFALVLALEHESPAAEITNSAGATGEGDSFIYLFDSASDAFVFTFAVPSSAANPKDVVVVPGSGYEDVWFTQPGAGRIGRLTYTDTTDYTFQDDYPLLTGSRPLNLVSGGGFIWFTDPGRDSIGRLDPATEQVDEFKVPDGAYPADLDYASDGSIWFTEMMRDRIARLVVASAGDYTVEEYSPENFSLAGSRPYGIVVAARDIVYFAETQSDFVTRFAGGEFQRLYDFTGATDAPNGPYELAVEGVDEVWTTERDGNRLTRFKMGTLQLAFPEPLTPAHSLPLGLAIDKKNDNLWFTQWAAGQIGKFRSDTGLQYHPLPSSDLTPTGIAVNGAGDVWVLASRPYGIYLPLVINSGG